MVLCSREVGLGLLPWAGPELARGDGVWELASRHVNTLWMKSGASRDSAGGSARVSHAAEWRRKVHGG